MQHVGIIRAYCLPGVNHYTFQCPGVGAEKIAGLWFARGESVPRIDSMIYKKWVYLSLRPVSQINNISIGLSANKMELQSKQIKDNFKRRIFIFLSKTPKLFEMFYMVFLPSFYFWLYYLVPRGKFCQMLLWQIQVFLMQ